MSTKSSREVLLNGMRILRNVNFTVTTLVIRLDDADDALVASINGSVLGNTASMHTLSVEAGVPSLTFLRSEPLATQKRSSSRGSTSVTSEGEMSGSLRNGCTPPPGQSPVRTHEGEAASLRETDSETLILYHQEASYRMMILHDVDMEFVSIVERAWNEWEVISLVSEEHVQRYWATNDEQQQRASITVEYEQDVWRFRVGRIKQELSVQEQVARENVLGEYLGEFGELESLENRCYLVSLAAARQREKKEEEVLRRLQQESDPDSSLVLPPVIENSAAVAVVAADEGPSGNTSNTQSLVKPPHPPPPTAPSAAEHQPVPTARRRATSATVEAICSARQSPKPSYASSTKFDQPMESLFLAWLCGGNPAVFIEIETAEDKVRGEILAQWKDEHNVIARRARKLAELVAGAKQALSFHEMETVGRRSLHGIYFAMLLEAAAVFETLHRRHVEIVEYPDVLRDLKSLETREYITVRRVVGLREEAERLQRNEDDKASRLLRIELDEALALQRLQCERYFEHELGGLLQQERSAWHAIEVQFATEYTPARIAQLEYEARAVTLVKTLPVCEALFYPERTLRSEIMEAEAKEFRYFQSLEVTSYLAARRNHLINADIAAQMKAMDVRNGVQKLKRRSSQDAAALEDIRNVADVNVPAA